MTRSHRVTALLRHHDSAAMRNVQGNGDIETGVDHGGLDTRDDLLDFTHSAEYIHKGMCLIRNVYKRFMRNKSRYTRA